MALVQCRECGNDVSTKATACPKCGAVLKKKTGCLEYIAAAFLLPFGLAAIISLTHESPSKNHRDARTSPPSDQRAATAAVQANDDASTAQSQPKSGQTDAGERAKPAGTETVHKGERNFDAEVCSAYRDAEVRSKCCQELRVPPGQCRFMENEHRASATSTPPPYPVAYTIVREKIYDAPMKTQINQDIVVSRAPTKAELQTEILRRYRAAMARGGFRYHNPPTNIYIRVYGTNEQARAQQGLWIGMIAKSYGDQGEPRVLINDDRLAALSQAPEERFGLSEETRKAVFRSIVAAEHKAANDASERFPDSQIMKQIDLERELAERYKAGLAGQYGLTTDQLHMIAIEGVKKGWQF